MIEFRYQALNAGRQESGSLAAASERDAVRQLTERGLIPLSVSVATTAATAATPSRRRARIKAVDVEQLLAEVGTLLKAGVSVAESLDSLATAYQDTALGPGLQAMRQTIRGGESFLGGLRAANLPLPEYAYALIASGEAAGNLSDSLADVAGQLAYERTVHQEMRNALIYPSILVTTGIAVILIVFVAVVPRFASLLKSGRADVPALSRWVIESGVFVKTHGLEFAGATVAAALIVAMLLRTAAARAQLQEAAFRAPLLGDWLRETDIGRWASLLGTLLSNRVPILQALTLSANAFRRQPDRDKVGQCAQEIRRGRPFSEVLGETGWLAPTRLNLVRVGERSGELPRMMRTLGEMQTTSARQRMKRFLIVIEPAAILLIGIVVGFLMVAVMMALTSLNTTVS